VALANFFSKNALAAYQILNGMDADTLSSILDQFVVGITFDSVAARSSEGHLTTSLCVNLAARLFPKLAVIPLSADDPLSQSLSAELADLANRINPGIEVRSEISEVSIAIVVGDQPFTAGRSPVFYAGSQDWWALFSPNGPLPCGNSTNPFGACAASCFALANVFRTIFGNQLEAGEPDPAFALSLFDYQRVELSGSWKLPNQPNVEDFDLNLGETILAGIGGIGNGTVFALSNVPRLRGILRLVDHEEIGLTNLQRYVLTTQADLVSKTWKVDRAAANMRKSAASRGDLQLQILPHQMRWSQYLAERNNWKIERVAMAFDSITDRLAVQPSLPRHILNAWTQVGDLGVSRHLTFGETACVGCLYLPRSGGKSEAELVGEALGFQGAPPFVRELLYSGAPIGEALVREVAHLRHIIDPDNVNLLLRFKDCSLRKFYNDAICGGVILALGGSANGPMIRAEAPMAFQSALAGVMLAAEIVIDAAQIRTAFASGHPPIRTVIDLTRPLAEYLQPPVGRRVDGLCFCDDQDYLDAYSSKYDN
jgi:hypothetical protein